MAYPISGSPVHPPHPTYSGVFIPEIWSTKVIEKYYDGTVLSQISNTDYEGEIKNMGDKVIIRTLPTIQVHDYEIGQTLQVDRPVGDTIELLIDKGLYWSVTIDDIIEKQQDINQMNQWAEDASEQLKIVLDTRVLANITPDVHADNKGAAAGRISGDINLGTTASPLGITKTNIMDTILYMGQVLDEQNVSETGRFLVMPYWATTLLKMSDIKDASLTGDSTSPLRNGRVGVLDRFTVYNSNLLPVTAGKTELIAGTSAGLTFATQLTKTESLRAESTFADIMRGLLVYGHKVVKPEALTSAIVTKA